jgi:hypothetical protein
MTSYDEASSFTKHGTEVKISQDVDHFSTQAVTLQPTVRAFALVHVVKRPKTMD